MFRPPKARATRTLVNKHQEAKDSAHTKNQASTAVNKNEGAKNTAPTKHQAHAPVQQRQEGRDTVHTKNQASKPANTPKGLGHRTCNTPVNKGQGAMDTANTAH